MTTQELTQTNINDDTVESISHAALDLAKQVVRNVRTCRKIEKTTSDINELMGCISAEKRTQT